MANKNIIKFVLTMLNFMAFVNYTLITPFLPPQGIELGLDNTMTALIFSLSQLFGGIFSYFAGYLCQMIGRKNTIIQGGILQVIAIAYCGVIYYTRNVWFQSISVSAVRIAQGAGDALVTIGIFALLSVHFHKEEYQSAIALVNAMVGMGIALGPLLGSSLVQVFGGNQCYALLLFAVVHGLIVLATFLTIEEGVTDAAEDKKLIETKPNSGQITGPADHPTQGFILSHEFCIFALASSFLAIGLIQIPAPVLASHLLKHFGTTEIMVGVFFFILNFAEFIGSMFLVNVTSINQNSLIVGGQAIMFMGMFIIGQPWAPILEIEQSLQPLGVGLFFVGFGMIFSFVTIVPAMVDQLGEKYGLTNEQKSAQGDLSAALFGVVFQEGGFFIPFAGGALMDWVGFEKMCLFCSLIPLLYIVLFGLRYNSFKNKHICAGQTKNGKIGIETKNYEINGKENIVQINNKN